MKVATWNVNSLRVRLPHVLKWLEREQPDLLALQETKLKDEDFPADAFRDYGYFATFSGQSAYNGVAILSREPPSVVSLGLGGHYVDEQKRVLGATFGAAASLELVRAERPERRLRRSSTTSSSGSRRCACCWPTSSRAILPSCVVGDFNIAPDDRDVYNPAAWQGKVLCTPAERAALAALCELGLRDAFRLFEQPERIFSWWDYRAGAFRRNQGLRIDLVLGLASVKSNVHGVPDRQGTARLGAAFGPRAGRRRIRCQLSGYVTWRMWATLRIS